MLSHGFVTIVTHNHFNHGYFCCINHTNIHHRLLRFTQIGYRENMRNNDTPYQIFEIKHNLMTI